MERIIHIIFDLVIGFIVKIVGFVMISAVLLQIVFRYLPFTVMWTEELGRITFVWFCMLSMAITFVKGMHLSIDYFYLKMKHKTQAVLDYIVLLLILAFSFSSTVCGIWLLEFTARQTSPVLQLSFFWFSLSVPVGFGLVTVFTVLSLIDRIFFRGRLVQAVSTSEQGHEQKFID